MHQIVFTALRMELSEQYRGCIGLSLIVFLIKSGPKGLSKLFILIELYCIIFFDIFLFLLRNFPLLPQPNHKSQFYFQTSVLSFYKYDYCLDNPQG